MNLIKGMELTRPKFHENVLWAILDTIQRHSRDIQPFRKKKGDMQCFQKICSDSFFLNFILVAAQQLEEQGSKVR